MGHSFSGNMSRILLKESCLRLQRLRIKRGVGIGNAQSTMASSKFHLSHSHQMKAGLGTGQTNFRACNWTLTVAAVSANGFQSSVLLLSS